MIPPAGDASPQPDNVHAGCAINASVHVIDRLDFPALLEAAAAHPRKMPKRAASRRAKATLIRQPHF
jgi:hypothetical protein